jgi:hypothetical protein
VARNGVNFSNTGFAVAEVDAINNEGLYSISATAAALSDPGIYEVVVYETATPANRFSFTIKVTNDGTFSGATSNIVWTASSGDGRVTDGATALPNATLRLLSGTNIVLQESLTDEAGIASLLLDDDSTYNLYATKSGYVSTRLASALIVSSGVVISSPGVDLELVADSTSSESITFADLIAYARRQKANASSEQSTTEIKESINEALLWLSGEYPWPHLCQEYQLCVFQPYTDGTISISSGSAVVLALSSVTFPSWSGDALLRVKDVFLAVSARDSDTQLTLAETWDAESFSGESYVLYRCEYDKPASLLGIQRFLDSTTTFTPVSDVTMAEKRVSRHAVSRSGFDYNLSNSKIKIWPCPTKTKVFKYIGNRRPTALVHDDDIADWDPTLLPLLRRAIDWQLAIRGLCKAGDVDKTFATLHQAVENAWGGMQDHRDMEYGKTGSSEDIFDGDMTDF